MKHKVDKYLRNIRWIDVEYIRGGKKDTTKITVNRLVFGVGYADMLPKHTWADSDHQPWIRVKKPFKTIQIPKADQGLPGCYSDNESF